MTLLLVKSAKVTSTSNRFRGRPNRRVCKDTTSTARRSNRWSKLCRYKAAVGFLEGFAKLLHEGSFAEFAAGFSHGELAVIKTESDFPRPSTSNSNAEQTKALKSGSVSRKTVQAKKSRPILPQSTKEDQHQGAHTGSAFTFSPSPKSPGLTRKQQRQVNRATKIRAVRGEAKQHAEREKPVTFEHVQKLLADAYTWSSVRSAMEDLKLKTCDVQENVEIRVQPDEPIPVVTSMLDLSKIEEAKASTPYDVEDSRSYVAYWKTFGCITQQQLTVMERIIIVKKILRDIGFTLDWIEGVSWNEADLHAAHEPFGDEHMLSKADQKGAVMNMPLGTKYLMSEATTGASLLAFREDMWLNLSCVITGLLFLQGAYKGVGVVNPSFYNSENPADRIKLASAFKPFDTSNRRIIGVLNITGSHWVAYCIDRRTRICQTFEPLQGSVKKMVQALREIVEPLLHEDITLAYTTATSCKQRDGSSCGVLCLAVLELLLVGKMWSDELYDLIPYLRLRYLNKSITLLAQGSDDRGVRL